MDQSSRFFHFHIRALSYSFFLLFSSFYCQILIQLEIRDFSIFLSYILSNRIFAIDSMMTDDDLSILYHTMMCLTNDAFCKLILLISSLIVISILYVICISSFISSFTF
jgi:hypothetical protein